MSFDPNDLPPVPPLTLFERALRHAVQANQCRKTAKAHPEAARGLTLAADRHHAEAGRLLAEWLRTGASPA